MTPRHTIAEAVHSESGYTFQCSCGKHWLTRSSFDEHAAVMNAIADLRDELLEEIRRIRER